MRIIVSFKEIIETGNWAKFCNDRGLNPYFINEGLGDSLERIELSLEEAKKYGLIKEN